MKAELRCAARAVLILLVGAIPVVPLAVLALLGAVLGIAAFVTGEPGGLAMALWGTAGVYGAACLWSAAFGRSSSFVVGGLITGCLAISPIVVMTLSSGGPREFSMEWLTILGPPVTAVAILIESCLRQNRSSGGSENRFELRDEPQRRSAGRPRLDRLTP